MDTDLERQMVWITKLDNDDMFSNLNKIFSIELYALQINTKPPISAGFSMRQ